MKHVITGLVGALLLCAPVGVQASPCGPVAMEDGGELARFEEAFLAKDWDAFADILTMFPQGSAAQFAEVGRNIRATFTGCELVFERVLEPLTYQRTTVFYTATGVGLFINLDGMLLQGEMRLIGFNIDENAAEILQYIR